jgi:hypothetical protein
MPVAPHTAYRIGLVVQILTDAGASGLMLEALGARSKLAKATLVEVLRIGLARHYVQMDGERYVATTYVLAVCAQAT